jgi:hypothetical protein
MAIGNLQLGPLRLRAPTTWEFFPFGNVILGRGSRAGSLQITLAYAKDAPANAGHEACVGVMRQFMDEPASKEAYSERVEQSDAIFGFVLLSMTRRSSAVTGIASRTIVSCLPCFSVTRSASQTRGLKSTRRVRSQQR